MTVPSLLLSLGIVDFVASWNRKCHQAQRLELPNLFRLKQQRIKFREAVELVAIVADDLIARMN